jgi:hypothetical protein
MTKEREDDTKQARDEPSDSGRVRLETLIPSLVKKMISQGVEVLSDEKLREKVVSEVVRRAIDKGGEVVDVTEESIRRVLGELQTGRELTDKVLGRLDEMKVEASRAVGEEISKFLSQVEVSNEVKKVLNGMVLDVRTEVRFKYDGESLEVIKSTDSDDA